MYDMKRIMPDTNIYEFILKDLELEKLRFAKKKGSIRFYGVDIIRKELRSIPKSRMEIVKGKNVKLRGAILSTYDLLVENHQYISDNKTKDLADDYYISYITLRGKSSKGEIINDFLIVASASLHDISIVVSNDNKTMLSNKSIRAYGSVNKLRKIASPRFIGFEEFKNSLGGVEFDKLV